MANTIRTVPVQCEWSVYAGDRNKQVFELFASEGVPWDLSAVTFKAQARADTLDATFALEATCIVEDAVAGLLSVAWDGEEVRTLLGPAEEWVGVWDLEALEPIDPLPVTLLAGRFDAHLDVTKP